LKNLRIQTVSFLNQPNKLIIMEREYCISCKKLVVNESGNAKFNCPSCSKYRIIRCKHCRKTAIKYRCPSCNFEGPN